MPQEIATPKRMFTNQMLRRLIIPLIIEQGLAIAVGMIDTIMISSVGEAAVSGVSLVDMINAVIITVFSALATGGAVVAAQYIGAKQPKMTKNSVKQLLMVSLVISLFLMITLLVFSTPLMRLLFGDIEPDVWNSAKTYLKVTAFSFPAIALYNAGAALFRAVGNSKISMWVSLLSNGINFVGNATFLFLFHWGVFGVALATLISRLAAMIIVLVLLSQKGQVITWEWQTGYKFDGFLVKRILGIGIPNSLENSLFSLGKIIIMSVVTSFGTSHIAANAVGNNFAALGCIPGSGMGLAILTVIGQCVGARDEEQIRYYTKKLLKITYLIGGAMNILILLTLPITIHFYNISADTSRLAIILILIHDGFAILLWPTAFSLPNALRAANDVKFTMIVSIFSMVTFRVLFSFILGKWLGMGVIGVWIAMIIDWCFRCILFGVRVLRKKWIEKALSQQYNKE